MGDIGSPEKIRFSLGVELGDGAELKVCVIEKDKQPLRELLFLRDNRQDDHDVGESGGGFRYRFRLWSVRVCEPGY